MERGTRDRSPQSYLAFPSGMAGVCAALDRVKQRPVGICKQDKQDLSAALEGLPKGRATTERQVPSYKRMFYQDPRWEHPAGGGGYSGHFHKTKSMTLIFRIIMRNESSGCILQRRPDWLSLSSENTAPQRTEGPLTADI